MKNEIFDVVRSVIASTCDVHAEDVKPESDLMLDLGMDSLDAVEVIMKMEQHYNIKVPDEETENIHTVLQLVNIVEKYVK